MNLSMENHSRRRGILVCHRRPANSMEQHPTNVGACIGQIPDCQDYSPFKGAGRANRFCGSVLQGYFKSSITVTTVSLSSLNSNSIGPSSGNTERSTVTMVMGANR